MEGGKVYFIAGLSIDQYSNNSLETIRGELRLTWIVINGVMGCIEQKIISWNNREKNIGIHTINRNIHGRETENHQNPVNTVNHVPSLKKCSTTFFQEIIPESGCSESIEFNWLNG